MHNLIWKRWPLADKLSPTMTCLVILLGTSITLASIDREQRAFRTELQQQADLQLNTLIAAGADALYNLDAKTLQDLMGGLGQNKVVTSGRFYDSAGRVIADAYSPNTRFSDTPDPFGQQLLKGDSAIFQWSDDELLAGKVLNAGDQRYGALSVALPTAPLEARIVDVRNQGIAAALIAVVLGALFSLLITQSITGPLRQMTDV